MLPRLLTARGACGSVHAASHYSATTKKASASFLRFLSLHASVSRPSTGRASAAALKTPHSVPSAAAGILAAKKKSSDAALDSYCTSLLALRCHQRGDLPFTMLCEQSQRAYLTLSKNRLAVKEFKLADIGEGIAQVELLKWYKNVGDTVEEMEDVCEVQSDKAAVQISSRFSGKVVRLRHQVGDFVRVGSPLMDIEVDGTDEDPYDQGHPAEAAATGGEARATGGEERLTTTAHTEQDSSSSNVSAAPATRRLAKEKGVDLRYVRGTGRNGIITKEDVLNYLKTGEGSSADRAAVAAPPPSSAHHQAAATAPLAADAAQAGVHLRGSLPSGERAAPGEMKKVVLRGFSRAMVKTMNESVKVPQLLVAESIDVTEIMAMRKRLAAATQGQVKPTITAFFLKAISLALDAHPILNSKFDAASGDSYEQFGSHNVSVAVDTPNGLVVPNIKDVQDRSVVEIQAELHRLQQLAKENRLSPKDLTGGTISLSNVGAIAGTLVHALLFDGQACIIGLGRAVDTPVFTADNAGTFNAAAAAGSPAGDGGLVLERRSIVSCSCTADHRHCDGATVARFMKHLKQLVEQPGLMLIQLR